MIFIRQEFKDAYPREEVVTGDGINIKYVLFLENSLVCAENELAELKDSIFYKIYRFFKKN